MDILKKAKRRCEALDDTLRADARAHAEKGEGARSEKETRPPKGRGDLDDYIFRFNLEKPVSER